MSYGTVAAQFRHSPDPLANLLSLRQHGKPTVGVTRRGIGHLTHARKLCLGTTAGFRNRCTIEKPCILKAFQRVCAAIVPEIGHTFDQKSNHDHEQS
jgi:hypothetical protein